MFWYLLGILCLVTVLAVVLVPHNVRVWRARRVYRRLEPEVIENVIAALQDSANQRAAVTFLMPMHGRACDDPTASHIGGTPYAIAGDAWPVTDSGPCKFLLQVRLDNPSLGEEWQGRLIEVFFICDSEQVVRSYGKRSLAAHSPLRPPRDYEPATCIPLRHVRVPQFRETDEGTSWSAQLLEDVPQINQILSASGRDTEGLLTQILCPEVYGYQLNEADESFVGGEPILIQNPHDPICKLCSKPLRFLFQFGEIIPNFRLADAGVCYVYGCDDHPDSCQGYIDSH